MNNWDSRYIEQIKDNTAKMADALTRISDALERLADRKTEPTTQTETQNSNLTFEKTERSSDAE